MDNELRIVFRESDITELKRTMQEIHQTLQAGETPMTMEETAEFLKSSKKYVHSLILKGLPHHKHGKLYFYKSEINEWLKKM